MKTKKGNPDIALQENEAYGETDCGCLLNCDGKLWLCPMHSVAPELLQALRQEHCAWDIPEHDKRKCKVCKIILKAEGGK